MMVGEEDANLAMLAHELACRSKAARERCRRHGHTTMWRDAYDHIEWFCSECGAACDAKGRELLRGDGSK